MKLVAIPLVVSSCVAAVSAEARADERAADVETDHLDAFDDGGPRSLALLTNPASLLYGAIGAEGDVLLGDKVALSLEAEWLAVGPSTGVAATVGVPLFPQGVALHGFYVHPRLVAVRAWAAGSHGDVAGAGATLGWEWTLRIGFTLRAGAGVAVDWPIGGDGSVVSAMVGVRPLLDANVGWVF